MISQEIEREYLNKQLDEVNKDIAKIEKEINELQSFTRTQEFRLEQKKNLKISLEKRLNNLSVGDNSLSSYLDSEKVRERDKEFSKNNQVIKNNDQQIIEYNKKLKETKNIFVKADLMIQRKKLEMQNVFLKDKNIRIEKNQRMYLATNRLVVERKNYVENFKVSVNSIKLRKMQEKYEAKITETHGLEEYKSTLDKNGSKIRSSIMGKVIEVYSKRDERVRSKFQKLLNTKSELLKIESARQFYDNYDLTRNQQKVLEGSGLSYDDITMTPLYSSPVGEVFKDTNGELFVKNEKGEIRPVTLSELEYVVNKSNELAQDSTPSNNGEVDEVVQTEQKETKKKIMKHPEFGTEEYKAAIQLLKENDIQFSSCDKVEGEMFYTLDVIGGENINNIKNKLNICTQIGLKTRFVFNGLELNNYDGDQVYNLVIPDGMSVNEAQAKLAYCTQLGLEVKFVLNGEEITNVQELTEEKEIKGKVA